MRATRHDELSHFFSGEEPTSARVGYKSSPVSANRSRALGRPSQDSRSIIVPSSPKGATLDNFRATEALAIMRSCFNVDSTVTARWLVDVREHYYVSLEYKLHVPISSQRPYDAFSSGFSLLIDALEARLRFPLHPVIKACLEGWQISPTQMAPNSWRYLVAFLWEYYRSSIAATRDLFATYFRLSQG
ncbi:hypothetical protein GW17_00051365 [Ensete ventricosum]|nr:hypothetical protein GW17_00051365 [Ensete ventricosum]